MSRMTPEQIGIVLSQAIRDGYAITLSRGGAPFVAEPYAIRRQSDSTWTLAYYNADARRFEIHQMGVFTDAVDLGRPLDALPGYASDEAMVRHAGEANYLYSTQEVADMLGVTPARVRALAESRGVGRKVGQGEKASWVFRQIDIAAMQERKPGRPRNGE